MDAVTLSRRCEVRAVGAAARRRVVAEVGPFRALIDGDNDTVWLNYAVPVGSLDDEVIVAEALEELRRVFVAYQRQRRFEFNALLWPGLVTILERLGLTLQVFVAGAQHEPRFT